MEGDLGARGCEVHRRGRRRPQHARLRRRRASRSCSSSFPKTTHAPRVSLATGRRRPPSTRSAVQSASALWWIRSHFQTPTAHTRSAPPVSRRSIGTTSTVWFYTYHARRAAVPRPSSLSMNGSLLAPWSMNAKNTWHTTTCTTSVCSLSLQSQPLQCVWRAALWSMQS